MNQDVREAVRDFHARLIGDGAYDVREIIVFGSQARGTFRPDSDTDVAVLLGGEHGRSMSTALAMTDHAYDVFLDTGVDISPLPVWLDDWHDPDRHSNPTLLRNIASEGIPL